MRVISTITWLKGRESLDLVISFTRVILLPINFRVLGLKKIKIIHSMAIIFRVVKQKAPILGGSGSRNMSILANLIFVMSFKGMVNLI